MVSKSVRGSQDHTKRSSAGKSEPNNLFKQQGQPKTEAEFQKLANSRTQRNGGGQETGTTSITLSKSASSPQSRSDKDQSPKHDKGSKSIKEDSQTKPTKAVTNQARDLSPTQHKQAALSPGRSSKTHNIQPAEKVDPSSNEEPSLLSPRYPDQKPEVANKPCDKDPPVYPKEDTPISKTKPPRNPDQVPKSPHPTAHKSTNDPTKLITDTPDTDPKQTSAKPANLPSSTKFVPPARSTVDSSDDAKSIISACSWSPGDDESVVSAVDENESEGAVRREGGKGR